jgi:hypothetical protein
MLIYWRSDRCCKIVDYTNKYSLYNQTNNYAQEKETQNWQAKVIWKLWLAFVSPWRTSYNDPNTKDVWVKDGTGVDLFHNTMYENTLPLFRFVFWDVLPCKIIVDRRFRGTRCPPSSGRSLGSTSQKINLNFILAAVRTWNLTHYPCYAFCKNKHPRSSRIL